MDVRCIRYHLEMLVYAFNQGRIAAEEFKKNFLEIKSFMAGNKKTVEILLLGLKDNKKDKELRWINNKSKILCTTTCSN